MTTIEFEQRVTPLKNAENVHTINKGVNYHRLVTNRMNSATTEGQRKGYEKWQTDIERDAQIGVATGNWKPLKMLLIDQW